MLAIILHWCAIWAGSPPDTFVEQPKNSTGAWLWLWTRVTGLTWRHAVLPPPVLVSSSCTAISVCQPVCCFGLLQTLLYRSNEWPCDCCITETSHSKRNTMADTQSREAPDIYSTICIWSRRDNTPSRPSSSTKEATITTLRVFCLGPRGPHPIRLRGCLPAGSPNPLWSLHLRITGDDHLP